MRIVQKRSWLWILGAWVLLSSAVQARAFVDQQLQDAHNTVQLEAPRLGANQTQPEPGQECEGILPGGDFESAILPPWSATGQAAVTTTHAYSGSQSVQLCGADGCAAEVFVELTLPGDAASLTLSWWAYIESDDPEPNADALNAIIRATAGDQLAATLTNLSARDEWLQGATDLSGYGGLTIGISFQAGTDEAEPTSFYLDGIRIMACRPTMPEYRMYFPILLRAVTHVEPEPTPTPTGAPPLVVNTTDDLDNGICDLWHCSLREAVQVANLNPGPDRIHFDIPAGDPGCSLDGVCTIRPTSGGYTVYNGDTTIDGYTQPGAAPNTAPLGQPINAVLKIVLDGSRLPSCCESGLDILSSYNVIRGLVIQRFSTGITVLEADGNRFEGSFVGTDASGSVDMGNRCTGILLYGLQGGPGSNYNVIGGSTPQARNLISANGCSGVEIGPGLGNRIHGNYIGTDAAGTRALPSAADGVRVFNLSQGNRVGGVDEGQGNLIAFNGKHGVEIRGGYQVAVGNAIRRNLIHHNVQRGIALLDGGNQGLGAPIITAVNGDEVTGTGCPGCTIEVFSDDEDEGAICEGTTTVDQDGRWTLTKPGGFAGPNLTSTATDALGNTSQFSAPAPK